MDVRKLRTRLDKDIVNSMAKKLIKDGLTRIKNQRQDSLIARENFFEPITKSQEAIKKTFGEKQDEIMAALANMTTIPRDGINALQQELERVMVDLTEEVEQRRELEDELMEAQRQGERQMKAAKNALEMQQYMERELEDERESANEGRRRVDELMALRQFDADILSGKERELGEMKKILNEGRRELGEMKKILNEGRRELGEMKKILNEGRRELDEMKKILNEGRRKIEENIMSRRRDVSRLQEIKDSIEEEKMKLKWKN